MACDPSDNISQGILDAIQYESKFWTGLDKSGDVHDTTPRKNELAGYYMHKSCYITISSSVHLEKSQQRKQKVTLLSFLVRHQL